MSRLATLVGALSAIVSLGDYLFAKSFLSHWLQRQVSHDADGWRVSPTFNLMCIVALVSLVWVVTESSAAEPEARKRLFRLRTNVVLGGLMIWFFLGPSIGDTDTGDMARPQAAAPTPQPAGISPPSQAATAERQSDRPESHGFTSQFTWKLPADPAPARGWRPGDGLRAMARILEDATGPASPDR